MVKNLNKNMIKRVALGISGGVDSAIAAVLLKNKGYHVQGVFMKNWDIADEKGSCKADEEYKDASFLCKHLNIQLHHVNFVKEYWNEVFCNLLKEYENGNTPNPDILCNKNVKFNYFYKYAMEQLKADAIATGHYAKTSFGPYLEKYNDNEGSFNRTVKLLRAQDTKKDQTFFLCQVEQEALRKTMFPLGDLMKWEVKQMAVESNLEKFALKHESMGICFIGSRNFQNFISEYIPDKPGHFVVIDTGKIVGEHNGLHQWTLGQRSRLQGLPEAYFTCRKSVQDNVLYVAQGTKHPSLFSTLFVTSSPHWIHSQPDELRKDEILHCDFKFQHTEVWEPCEVCRSDQGLVVKLENPKRALTAGQYAVFYRGDECLGSAKIIDSGATNFSLYYLRNGMLNGARELIENLKNVDSLDNKSSNKNVKCKDKSGHDNLKNKIAGNS